MNPQEAVEKILVRLEQIEERLEAVDSTMPEAAVGFMIHARGDIKFLLNLANKAFARGSVRKPVKRGDTLAQIALRETGDLPTGFRRISSGKPVESVEPDPKTVLADPPNLNTTSHEVLEILDAFSLAELDFSKMSNGGGSGV